MTKKLGVVSGIINIIVFALLITASVLFAILTVRLAVDCINSGLATGLIVGVPFCVFITAVLAGGGITLAVFAVKSFIAIKKDNEKEQKNIATAFVAISAAFAGACVLFLIITLADYIFGKGGDFSALIYELIALAVAIVNLTINIVIMKKLKQRKTYEQ